MNKVHVSLFAISVSEDWGVPFNIPIHTQCIVSDTSISRQSTALVLTTEVTEPKTTDRKHTEKTSNMTNEK